MARIEYFDISQADPQKKIHIGSDNPINITRMLAHASTPVMRDFLSMGCSLYISDKLDPILRELAVVRTGLQCGSEYEVYQHMKIARRLGIDEEKLAALAVGSEAPVFSPLEKLVLRFTEEIVADRKASTETFQALQAHFANDAIVELVILVSFYCTVSSFLMTMEVDIDER